MATQNQANGYRTIIHDEVRHRAAEGEPSDTSEGLRTYVLDTSVLLSDPGAIMRFAEHSVVLPVVVITELEKKRHDPEIGYFARRALRLLDDLREQHERLDFPVPIGDAGGTLRIELVHDTGILPAGIRLSDNDTAILAVAAGLAQDGQRVTVVSKDLPMRVKAASIGLDAEEYRYEQARGDGYTGVEEILVTDEQMATLWDVGRLDDASQLEGVPLGTGLTAGGTP